MFSQNAGYVIVLLAMLTIAPPQTRAEDCSSQSMTQSDLTTCAQKHFEEADKALNDVYSNLVAKLSVDEKEKLKKAQRTWIAYRDAQCQFNTMGTNDGSVHPMVYAECLTTLTKQQAAILEEQGACPEGVLSCVRK